MKPFHCLLLVASFLAAPIFCSAKDYSKPPKKGGTQPINFRAACTTAQAQVDMDINNVRARLLTGGDLMTAEPYNPAAHSECSPALSSNSFSGSFLPKY